MIQISGGKSALWWEQKRQMSGGKSDKLGGAKVTRANDTQPFPSGSGVLAQVRVAESQILSAAASAAAAAAASAAASGTYTCLQPS